MTPYVHAYAPVPDLGYTGMGSAFNLPKVKRLFQNAHRNVLYTSVDMMNKTDTQIRSDFERIARELGPCELPRFSERGLQPAL